MRLKEHTAILGKNDVFRVDPRALKIDPGFNVRDLDAPTAREALDVLKESIRIEGVQVELEIRMVNDDLFIVSGHRRHKVVMELIAEGVEIASVPAKAEAKTISEAERVARLITLNSGEPLSPLEKSEVVRRLLNYGWGREQIRNRLGLKTVQTIANYELLLGAPEDVRQAVRDGEVSATTAIAMVRESGSNASQALSEARTKTTAKGKTRITTATRKPADAPAGNRPPSAVEASNMARINHAAANADKLAGAMSALAELVKDHYAPGIAASEYTAHTSAEVSAVVEWLYEFEDRMRGRSTQLNSLIHADAQAPA